MAVQVTQLVLTLCVLVAGAMAQGICGATGRTCIVGFSECVNGECVCINPYIWGDPYFMCYKKNTVATESRNDPSLTNYNNETYEFPYPCRYLMTHFKQELKDRYKNVIGKCEFKVHAYNKREKGKLVTHGYDIATKIVYNNGSTISISARKYGTAASGNPTFDVSAKYVYAPDGSWVPSVWSPSNTILYKDQPNGIVVECSEEPDNNQIVFDFKACGVRITFVPYDVVDRRTQKEIPGLSVGVNCAHHPKWLSNDEVLGLAPKFQDGNVVADILKPGLSPSQSLVDRAFLNGATQNQPDANPACASGTSVLSACTPTQKAAAYYSCFWMLKEAKFIKCAYKSNLNFLDLFVRCVAAFCAGGDCNAVRADIDASCGHVTGVASLTQFLSGALCP